MVKSAQFKVHRLGILESVEVLFAVELAMDTNERQIALAVLENLREDLPYARLLMGVASLMWPTFANTSMSR